MVWFWRLGRSVDSNLEGRQGVVSGRGELASLLDSRKCRLAGGSGAGGRGAGGGAVSAIRAASGASRVACPHCRGWHADRGPVRGAAVSTGGFRITAMNPSAGSASGRVGECRIGKVVHRFRLKLEREFMTITVALGPEVQAELSRRAAEHGSLAEA